MFLLFFMETSFHSWKPDVTLLATIKLYHQIFNNLVVVKKSVGHDFYLEYKHLF